MLELKKLNKKTTKKYNHRNKNKDFKNTEKKMYNTITK